MTIEYDEDGYPFLPGHQECWISLGTPRQFTQRGGWNIACECGTVFAESGDEDFDQRLLQHLLDTLE